MYKIIIFFISLNSKFFTKCLTTKRFTHHTTKLKSMCRTRAIAHLLAHTRINVSLVCIIIKLYFSTNSLTLIARLVDSDTASDFQIQPNVSIRLTFCVC